MLPSTLAQTVLAQFLVSKPSMNVEDFRRFRLVPIDHSIAICFAITTGRVTFENWKTPSSVPVVAKGDIVDADDVQLMPTSPGVTVWTEQIPLSDGWKANLSAAERRRLSAPYLPRRSLSGAA